MTIQSQLDQVLAPCPFCGGEPFDHAIEPHTHSKFLKDIVGIPDHGGSHVVECGCGAGFIADTKAEVFALWNRRAAVGGEAVAWILRRKRDGFVRGCYATKPTDESLEFAELDGDYYTPLYASPPATVGVGALSERVSDLLHRIEGFGKAYPTDMFSEVTTEEREWLHATRPGLMDRIAASMGRHVSEKIADDLASIRDELAALIGKEA